MHNNYQASEPASDAPTSTSHVGGAVEKSITDSVRKLTETLALVLSFL